MGCTSSKATKSVKESAEVPKPTPAPEDTASKGEAVVGTEHATAVEDIAEDVKKPKIYIVYYSMYGHIEKLARAAAAGMQEAVSGADVRCYRVRFTVQLHCFKTLSDG
jgi:NAD(P)H dehydrogenase (quinone)